ncbi:hypothetical protein COO60DRAFT_537325 [Scenedesmus sp. NREL 46B-D3]|nr:hypothetical protein COO60DRAFT_537325 [Scenedesmus sp. NREL 46B-D3]
MVASACCLSAVACLCSRWGTAGDGLATRQLPNAAWRHNVFCFQCQARCAVPAARPRSHHPALLPPPSLLTSPAGAAGHTRHIDGHGCHTNGHDHQQGRPAAAGCCHSWDPD